MQTTNIAITILSVLDAAILLLTPLLDKSLYKNNPKIKSNTFSSNPNYGISVCRFIYIVAGVWLLYLIFISALVILKTEHITKSTL